MSAETKQVRAADHRRGGPLLRDTVVRRARYVFTVGELGVLAPLVVAVVVFSVLNPSFLSRGNIVAMLTGMSFIGIIAVAQTLLLIAGEFDLSVGSNASLSAIVAAWSMVNAHVPTVVGILIGILVGAGVGLVNAIVVLRFRIPAFIATIGMLYVAQGLSYVVSGGYPIYPLPKLIGDLGNVRVLDLSISFLLLIVLVVVGEFVLRRTTFGRAAFATGGNAEVARIAGINPDAIKAVCFVLVGACSGLTGIFVMASVASASSSIGQGYELNVIAAVVIGGVSLFGGIGSVAGAILGVLLLQVVQSGLVTAGLSANWQTVAVGLIMIVAVGIDVLRRRVRAGARPAPITVTASTE